MVKEDVIIFWHRGNSWYLKIALQQAQKFNSNIVLLGDDKNSDVWNNFYNMDKLPNNQYEAFKKVYKNYSLNNEVFELRCFERYFYVYEYCKRMQLSRIVLCDSDLLVYQNLMQYFDGQIRAFSHTVLSPDGMAVSPHCSLWTLEDLESFVNYLVEYYSLHAERLEKIFVEYKKMYNKGGICDMTLLWLWLHENRLPYFNTAIVNVRGGGIRSCNFTFG